MDALIDACCRPSPTGYRPSERWRAPRPSPGATGSVDSDPDPWDSRPHSCPLLPSRHPVVTPGLAIVLSLNTNRGGGAHRKHKRTGRFCLGPPPFVCPVGAGKRLWPWGHFQEDPGPSGGWSGASAGATEPWVRRSQGLSGLVPFPEEAACSRLPDCLVSSSPGHCRPASGAGGAACT